MSTFSFFNEREVERVIDKKLDNLGWADSNVYRHGNVKTRGQKKLLGALKPDYVLYSSNSIHPIAIIEAKKDKKDLYRGIEQGSRYAEKLKCPIVFSSNGILTKTFHLKYKTPMFRNNEEVDEFLREVDLLKYLDNNDVYTTEKKIVKNRTELISIFNHVNKTLRKDGISAGVSRFSEFANILFLKVISEMENYKEQKGQPTNIPSDYRWDAFRDKRGEMLMSYINDTVISKFQSIYNSRGGG